jgi:hypothetical protein
MRVARVLVSAAIVGVLLLSAAPATMAAGTTGTKTTAATPATLTCATKYIVWFYNANGLADAVQLEFKVEGCWTGSTSYGIYIAYYSGALSVSLQGEGYYSSNPGLFWANLYDTSGLYGYSHFYPRAFILNTGGWGCTDGAPNSNYYNGCRIFSRPV